MITVSLPNGQNVEVDTDDPQAAAQAAHSYQSAQTPPPSPDVLPDMAKAAASGVGVGGGMLLDAVNPLNMGKDLVGDAKSLYGMATGNQQMVNQNPALSGYSTPATSLMNGMYTPQTDAGRYTQAATMGATTGLLGGVPGIVSGIGSGIGSTGGADIAQSMGYNQDVGGLLGGLAGGLAGGVGLQAVQGNLIKDFGKTQSNDQLRAMAKDAYDRADQAGISFKAGKFNDLADDIVSTAQAEGLDPTLTPGSMAVIQRIREGAAQPVTLSQMETLRKVVGNVNNPTNPADMRLAGIIRDKLDDFVETGDVTGSIKKGDPAGIEALQQGRAAWQQLRKNETVDEIFRKVDERGSTVPEETAIKTQFRQLSNNKKAMRGFSADEKAAIRTAATTGIIERGLRGLSAFSPTAGKLGAAMAGGAGIGAVMGNPALAVLPVAGLLGDMGYGAIARSKANYARGLIKTGGGNFAIPGAPQIAPSRMGLLQGTLGGTSGAGLLRR